MRRRFSIAVSAMVLAAQFGGAAAAQELPLRQLETISAFLDANDLQGLRTYLSLRPSLLEGDSDLAQLLRDYMAATDDPVGFLGVSPERGGDDDDGEVAAALREAVAAAERSRDEDDVPSAGSGASLY